MNRIRMYHLAIVAVLIITGISTVATIARYELATTEGAGVCVYKGPFIYGGFFGSSSDGIPLRNINVTAEGFSNLAPDVLPFNGLTDRTGCVIFQVPRDWSGRLWYHYNGTYYEDPIQAGLVLRDNIP